MHGKVSKNLVVFTFKVRKSPSQRAKPSYFAYSILRQCFAFDRAGITIELSALCRVISIFFINQELKKTGTRCFHA